MPWKKINIVNEQDIYPNSVIAKREFYCHHCWERAEKLAMFNGCDQLGWPIRLCKKCITEAAELLKELEGVE